MDKRKRGQPRSAWFWFNIFTVLAGALLLFITYPDIKGMLITVIVTACCYCLIRAFVQVATLD